MAKKGLKGLRYAIITESAAGVITYGGAKTPGHAISYAEDVTSNDAKLYGDDVVVESDTSFSGGTATIGIDREDLTVYADLLGHTIGTDGELQKNPNDVAPYVGVGRVVVLTVDNATVYRAKITRKMKCSLPSSDESTKGESVEFGTYELSAQILAPSDGSDWQLVKDFGSAEAAISYIETTLGGTVSA